MARSSRVQVQDSIMTLSLNDLPSELLKIIARYYRQFQRRDAATTLQAALKRHLVMRCDHPRHTARTNTPGEAPVLCYQYCHQLRSEAEPHKNGVGTLCPDLSLIDPGCFIGSCKAHPGSLRMASFSKERVPSTIFTV